MPAAAPPENPLLFIASGVTLMVCVATVLFEDCDKVDISVLWDGEDDVNSAGRSFVLQFIWNIGAHGSSLDSVSGNAVSMFIAVAPLHVAVTIAVVESVLVQVCQPKPFKVHS